jgi:hypothetical protein
MNAADIKRQILEASEKTGIRKKISSGETGMTSEDVVEAGDALERMTQTKGWSYIEAYILKRCNPAIILESDDASVRITARSLMYLMQYVNEMILAKNDYIRRQNEEREKDSDKR